MERDLKTTVIQWGAGDYMIEKDMKIRCILPISENPWDTNQNSMVLLLQYKKFSMLFTGDIDEKVEPLMLSIIQEEQLLGINY